MAKLQLRGLSTKGLDIMHLCLGQSAFAGSAVTCLGHGVVASPLLQAREVKTEAETCLTSISVRFCLVFEVSRGESSRLNVC